MLSKKAQKYTKPLQKILITLVLSVLYIFGFGLTLVFAAIFNRRLLGIAKRDEKTFWKEAQGYSADINECLRES